MKVLAFVLSVLMGTALLLGVTLLITVTTPNRGPALTLLGVMACTVLVYGPLTLGALTSYWEVRGSRYFRRLLVVVLAGEALGAVGIVLFAMLVGSPVWVPVVVVLGGAVSTAVALLGGRLLYRHSLPDRPSGDGWSPISTRDIQRRILIVAGVFVGTFAIGAIAFPLLPSDDSDKAHVVSSLGFALQFALLAGSMTCVILTIPLNRRLRSTVGGDLENARRIARVVLGRKSLELDAEQQAAAARYAAIAPTVLSFTLTYFVLLYGALFLRQARLVADGRGVLLATVLLILLVAVLVVFVPYHLVRIRRAQRYAREHANLLRTGQSSAR